MIIMVNQAWRDFFSENRGDDKITCEGANYIKVCEQSEGKYSVEGNSFANGIRAVLNRQIDRFEMEHPSLSENQLRWFLGRVNGLEINGKRYALALHENISEYKYKDFQSL